MRKLIYSVGVSGLIGALWLAATAEGRASAPVVRAVDGVAQPPVPSVTVVRVVAERFAFTPSEVVVEQGTTIEFHLTSDDTDHGFRIIGTDVDLQIPKRRRGEAVVRYTAETAGRYAIECSRPCGAGHTAMRGTLVVK